MKPAPSFNNTPENMNPEADSIWRHAVTRYSDDIYEVKNLREQWAKAISHYHRLCALEGIEPYLSYHEAATALGDLVRKL